MVKTKDVFSALGLLAGAGLVWYIVSAQPSIPEIPPVPGKAVQTIGIEVK